MTDIKMEAAIFFDSHVPNALRQALEYAGDDGFVASMPQLLHARANAAYDNIILSSYDIELMGDPGAVVLSELPVTTE